MNISEQLNRISKMETLLDKCSEGMAEFEASLEKYEALREKIKELSAYYSSPEWMSDYDDSNSGKLPRGLKCGVLSEDAVFDLLTDERRIAIQMMETALKVLKGE